MIRLLFIFLLLGFSVWLGLQLYHDPGYLFISINQWTVETTLLVAVVILIFLFYLLYLVSSFIQWLIALPTSWKKWRAKHLAQKAQETTRLGLIEFSEGYWHKAKNHLIKALPNTDTPLLNYLTAARAAQELGDSKLRDDYLRQAQQSMPDAKIAVELTQAQLQLANGQWEQALATLRHLQDLAPHHPYVLKLLMHLYEEVKDWPQLIALLPDLKRNHILSTAAYDALQHRAYLQAIKDLIKQNQAQALKDQMESLPKNLIFDSELIAEYSQYLLNHQDYKRAESILRHTLSKHFDERLIELYGHVQGDEANLKFAESLLKEHPHSAALFLCLGRLCVIKNLWGKAKIYFETSIKITATAAAYAELGQLLQQLNDQEGACDAYRRGLILTLRPLKSLL